MPEDSNFFTSSPTLGNVFLKIMTIPVGVSMIPFLQARKWTQRLSYLPKATLPASGRAGFDSRTSDAFKYLFIEA